MENMQYLVVDAAAVVVVLLQSVLLLFAKKGLYSFLITKSGFNLKL
jgi:hypothetical protein